MREAEGGAPSVVLIATGSEMSIAMAARDVLQGEGRPTRIVSLPCWELFDAQEPAYRDEVLGGNVLRIGIEAAVSFGWERYLGQNGVMIGMKSFGASAPASDLYPHFGITVEAVTEAARKALTR